MRKFLAFALLIILTPATFAKISISESHQIPNDNVGYCAWVSLETIGNHLQLPTLYNYYNKRKNSPDTHSWDRYHQKWFPKNNGSEGCVEDALAQDKVSYIMQMSGNKNPGILQYAEDNKLPIMVGVRVSRYMCHVIVLTEYTDKHVTFIDCNHQGKEFTQSKEEFINRWTGYAFIITK